MKLKFSYKLISVPDVHLYENMNKIQFEHAFFYLLGVFVCRLREFILGGLMLPDCLQGFSFQSPQHFPVV